MTLGIKCVTMNYYVCSSRFSLKVIDLLYHVLVSEKAVGGNTSYSKALWLFDKCKNNICGKSRMAITFFSSPFAASTVNGRDYTFAVVEVNFAVPPRNDGSNG